MQRRWTFHMSPMLNTVLFGTPFSQSLTRIFSLVLIRSLFCIFQVFKNYHHLLYWDSLISLVLDLDRWIWYMSKITRTQNFGLSRWRNPKLATIGPESCLGEVARGLGYPETCQSPTYTLPCPMVASFGLRNIQDFSAYVMSDADGVSDADTTLIIFSR